MMKKYIFITLVFSLLLTVSCNKVDPEEQAEIDKTKIDTYVSDNNLTGSFNASDLWYSIDSQGGGVQAYSGATVTVVYTGYLLDGTQFDQSPLSGATFSLNNVIVGWQQGIPKFKEGGSGRLVIPSGLGYGTQATGSIPENSVLIFDIELIDVL